MLQGSMVALVTPMLKNGEVDEAALEALVEFHIENGTDVIVAAGTTGESATMSHKEHRRVVKRIAAHANKRIPVIAGTGSNSTEEALELTIAAKEDGADACLLVVPYYNKPTQEGLYQHYKYIADRVDIPQLLYNVPGRTVADLLPETVERLSLLPNIVGIKEATGDLERVKYFVKNCASDFSVISGDDPTAMDLMLLGGKGNISVTANVAPKLMHDMCTAAIAGDRETASALNQKMDAINALLFIEANPIPVKWATHKMGYGSDHLRLPLTTLSVEHQSPLLEEMKALGIQTV